MQGWGVFEKWCVKVASDAGGNETAGLVVTMGHGEGREQAWLVYGSVWGELAWAWEQLLPWKDVSGGGGWLGHRSARAPLEFAVNVRLYCVELQCEF